MSRPRYFNYYSDIASFPSEAAVQRLESGGNCSVNIDGKCVDNLPLAARAAVACGGLGGSNGSGACPQRAPLFCASNQPYAAESGWACATQRQGLSTVGI